MENERTDTFLSLENVPYFEIQIVITQMDTYKKKKSEKIITTFTLKHSLGDSRA